MNFHLRTAEIYVPDGVPVDQALARTTHLCVSAHQDDIEIMAAQPIMRMLPAERQMVYGRGGERRTRLAAR